MVGGSPFTSFIPIGVSLLSAIAAKQGHDFKFFDLCKYDFGIADEHEVGELNLEYKKVSNPERASSNPKLSRENINRDFKNMVNDYGPDMIALSAMSSDYNYGKALLSEAKQDIKIPVIVGGVAATVDKEAVISEDWVDMINVGQGEESFQELINSFERNNEFDTTIKNIWFKRNGEIIKNPLRSQLTDLDNLPFPDWSIFDEYRFYRPYLGYVYRYGGVEVTRGCPFNCHYCINSFYKDMYSANTYSIKSVERAISEFEYLKNKYDLEFFGFMDENFLYLKLDYIEEFAGQWQKRINLPFLCQGNAHLLTREKVMLLKKMGCVTVGLGLETGNEEVRKNVLNKSETNEKYENAYRMINEAGIRSVGQLMFGSPHESIDDYKMTLRLIKKWNVDTVHFGILYPYKGSFVREMAIKEGLLDKNKIEEYERNSHVSHRTAPTMFEFSDEHKKKMYHYKKCFNLYKEIPEWLWPLVDMLEDKDDDFSRKIASLLTQLIYKHRFGD